MFNDLRHGLRLFGKHPSFTAVAVITLALGVGANTAIFSVVHAIILNPLPYPGGDRMVYIWNRSPRMNLRVALSAERFETFRAAAQTFDAMEAWTSDERTLTGAGDPEIVNVARASAGLLPLLGGRTMVGRATTPDDARTGAAPVALMAESLWRSRFGADEQLVGATVTLDDRPHTVAGILPDSLRLPGADRPQFVIPLATAGASERTRVRILARTRPGVTNMEAEEELRRIAAALPEPRQGAAGWSPVLTTPQDRFGARLRQSVLVLFGAVACLLLIACANVTNLVLARNAGRERELAVRRALGAGAWRLVRQIVIENTLLGVAGGAAALLMAMWTLALVTSLRPPVLAQVGDLEINTAVLAFNLALSCAASVLFGLAPVLGALRLNVHGVLRGSAHGAVSPGGRHLLRRGLLVAEIALALVLLTGAGLLARSFGRLQSTPLGFDSTGVLTAAINLPASRYATPAARSAFRRDMLARVRALPSVEGATMALGVPPSLGVLFGDARVDGRALPASQQPGEMAGVYVGDGYFDLLRIRVLEGRTFGPLDANGDDVVIVNASAARRFWPGRSAVGGRFGVGAGDATVIGVVDDVKANGLAESPGGVQIYYPFDKDSFAGGTLIVRTAGDPMAIVAALKAAVWAGDNRLALRNVSPATDLIATSLAPQRFNLVLLAIFAGLGVVLAVVGVYGVMMYFAAQREHEMGVRLALGATRRDVMRLVLRQSAVVTLAGLAIGIGASWALSRFLTSLLFEVAPTDPATFTATAAVLALAAFAGTSIPAWRVAKVDPVKALRAD